jgi:drug/metabolite transporter (DMT)-like permease
VTAFATLVYMAGRTTTALNLSLISITFPIFIILFSRIFLGERIGWLRSLGIALVLAGVVFLITKGRLSASPPCPSLGGCLDTAFLPLLGRVQSFASEKTKELNLWAFQGATFVLGWVFLAPFYFFGPAISAPIGWNLTIILSILYVALMASLLAFIFWNKAVERLGASRAGILYYSMPLFSGLLAYLILGEDVGFIHLVSALLIVPGIAVANYSPLKKAR